jgi:chromosome segregation ATPase
MLCFSQPAFADDQCIDYAKPLATTARLLAKSIAATTEALVALNKRANANDITSFNDFVESAQERSEEMVETLNEQQERIMERAESTTDYTLCKKDLQDEIDTLKESTAKAQKLLIELKDSIKDLLDELKGAFFG